MASASQIGLNLGPIRDPLPSPRSPHLLTVQEPATNRTFVVTPFNHDPPQFATLRVAWGRDENDLPSTRPGWAVSAAGSRTRPGSHRAQQFRHHRLCASWRHALAELEVLAAQLGKEVGLRVDVARGGFVDPPADWWLPREQSDFQCEGKLYAAPPDLSAPPYGDDWAVWLPQALAGPAVVFSGRLGAAVSWFPPAGPARRGHALPPPPSGDSPLWLSQHSTWCTACCHSLAILNYRDARGRPLSLGVHDRWDEAYLNAPQFAVQPEAITASLTWSGLLVTEHQRLHVWSDPVGLARAYEPAPALRRPHGARRLAGPTLYGPTGTEIGTAAPAADLAAIDAMVRSRRHSPPVHREL